MNMASCSQPSKSHKSSINYWWIPLDARSFNRIHPKENAATHNISHTESRGKSETKSTCNGMSTPEFVSALGDIWDLVGQPAVFHTKDNLKYDEILQRDNIIFSAGSQRRKKTAAPLDGKCSLYDLKSGNCFSYSAKSDFERLTTLKKMLLFASCSINNPFANGNVEVSDSTLHADHTGVDKLASAEIPNVMEKTCGKIMWKPLFRLRSSVKLGGPEGIINTCEVSSIEKENLPADVSDTLREEGAVVAKCEPSSVIKPTNTVGNMLESNNSLDATYSFLPVRDMSEALVALRSPSSTINLDYDNESLDSADDTFGEDLDVADSCSAAIDSPVVVSTSKQNIVQESNKSLSQETYPQQIYSSGNWLLLQDKIQHAFSKNKHALAGALAGTLVSLCLHPIDTVKTIIQSNGVAEKPCYDTVKTIISEKGVMGLYRGIASNIASSAPISAIYTFTYETVKGALLPFLPKEYYSLAHCSAGACSSIATSFIFTPSEHIKQQMQVGLQYQNCWNALIGCLQRGGVSALYAGWGAVLCRNIPHSIIKFYTYESLKQLFLSSAEPDTKLNTWQTLVCGGLAGSTAALFTTPFDVVKTRLQTQAPGTIGQYSGVFHALQEIAAQEGLQGLYRGLTPRLAMYVSQGAIFFASYEFLKALFSLEVPGRPVPVVDDVQQDQSKAPRIQSES